MKSLIRLMLLCGVLCIVGISQAQQNLAATLEVLTEGVTVQRVGTSNPIEVRVEAIVGVGDTITTNAVGAARITWFADGTTTEIEPSTSYLIEEFTENGEEFTLRVRVLAGITRQQLGRVVGADSTYEIETPGMTMAARGTVFAVRVENNGRSGMIVSEGAVIANADAETENVAAQFGIRSETGGALSDVVRASSFAELDSALDGCRIQVEIAMQDVALNLRAGPSFDSERIGFLDPLAINIVFGTDPEGEWYRIPAADGFGWFFAPNATTVGSCAGLRVFDTEHREGTRRNPTPQPTATPDGNNA